MLPGTGGFEEGGVPRVTKAGLRREILARRGLLGRGTLAVTAGVLRDHVVGAVRGAGATRVCAYLPLATEPGSSILLDALTVGGVEVLLPILLDDLDLDWAMYEGPWSLVASAHGLREPAGPRLGTGAVATSGIVIVPALAVDGQGHRLGRGGGSYDRALARVLPGVPVVALLHDGEILAQVPHEPHDRAVTHVVTPDGGWQQIDHIPPGGI
ncbi:MAG: 5-formyltetrahydrofolate cyclo-ligase [Pseudonocardiales bacterium]